MHQKNIVILGSPEGWHSQQLQFALEKRGANVSFADATQLTASLGTAFWVCRNEINLGQCDVLLVREVPGGSLEQVIFRMDALHQLENAGLKIINSPYAIEKMVDKYYTLALLQQSGIPVPDTRVCENIDNAMNAYQELGGDTVIKPLFGSRGIGMVRVNDPDSAWRACKALQLGNYVYYLQKFIPHYDRDLRVLVVCNECIAGMERVAGTWKTNIAAGAQPVFAQVTDKIENVCKLAAQSVGADYCGVDLILGEDGKLYVIEINSMPAWQGLQQVTPFNITNRIADYIVSIKP